MKGKMRKKGMSRKVPLCLFPHSFDSLGMGPFTLTVTNTSQRRKGQGLIGRHLTDYIDYEDGFPFFLIESVLDSYSPFVSSLCHSFSPILLLPLSVRFQWTESLLVMPCLQTFIFVSSMSCDGFYASPVSCE